MKMKTLLIRASKDVDPKIAAIELIRGSPPRPVPS
jgi:hypothetical protein